MTDTDILSVLTPFSWTNQKPVLPGFTGAKAIMGRRGPVVFIATEDHDGQIEISLSQYIPGKRAMTRPKPCTEAQARAFFRVLGVDPVESVKTETIRHFVVRRGSVQ